MADEIFFENMKKLSEKKDGIIEILDSLRVEELDKKYNVLRWYQKDAGKIRDKGYEITTKDSDKLIKVYDEIKEAGEKKYLDSEELGMDFTDAQEIENHLIKSSREYQSSFMFLKNKVTKAKEKKRKQMDYYRNSVNKHGKECHIKEKIAEMKNDIDDIIRNIKRNGLDNTMEQIDKFYKKSDDYLDQFKEFTEKIKRTNEKQKGNAEKTCGEVGQAHESTKATMYQISKKLKEPRKKTRHLKNKYFMTNNLFINPVYKTARWTKNKVKTLFEKD